MTALAGYYGHADSGPYSGLQRAFSEVCCCGARPLLELKHGRKRAIACVLTAMQRTVGDPRVERRSHAYEWVAEEREYEVVRTGAARRREGTMEGEDEDRRPQWRRQTSEVCRERVCVSVRRNGKVVKTRVVEEERETRRRGGFEEGTNC
jgi:hypothetical protein